MSATQTCRHGHVVKRDKLYRHPRRGCPVCRKDASKRYQARTRPALEDTPRRHRRARMIAAVDMVEWLADEGRENPVRVVAEVTGLAERSVRTYASLSGAFQRTPAPMAEDVEEGPDAPTRNLAWERHCDCLEQAIERAIGSLYGRRAGDVVAGMVEAALRRAGSA
ncbi:MAG: hypothetical protein LC798_13610 [Chloroflexi bacterium]|nr:hypothetical protein [Chloroflexota bacterium]